MCNKGWEHLYKAQILQHFLKMWNCFFLGGRMEGKYQITLLEGLVHMKEQKWMIWYNL